jgi:cell division septum initiation protein DivIVA
MEQRSITAEAMRATADRVAENAMAAADIMHEQAEQFVDELCQRSNW